MYKINKYFKSFNLKIKNHPSKKVVIGFMLLKLRSVHARSSQFPIPKRNISTLIPFHILMIVQYSIKRMKKKFKKIISFNFQQKYNR